MIDESGASLTREDLLNLLPLSHRVEDYDLNAKLASRLLKAWDEVQRLRITHRCTMCSLEVRIPAREIYDGCPQLGCAGKLAALTAPRPVDPTGHTFGTWEDVDGA